jgi:GGDEF domain-containing protein
MRAGAEDSIANKISSGKEFIVGLFVMDRLASINGRFGRLVGDEILLMGAQHLAQKLSGAALYRWSGPAFVAILDISGNAAAVENHLKQAGAMRFEKTIEADNRSVLLLVTSSFQVTRVSHSMSPDAIFRGMDTFLSENFTEAVE